MDPYNSDDFSEFDLDIPGDPDGPGAEPNAAAEDFLDLGEEMGSAFAPSPAPERIVGEDPFASADSPPMAYGAGEPGPTWDGSDTVDLAPPPPPSVAGTGVDFFEDELDADDGEEDGSWLMSLDEDVSDRAGVDPIVPGDSGDPFASGPGTLDAAWHEDSAAPVQASRVVAPMTVVLIVVLLGLAGWQLLDLREERSRGGLEALPGTGPSKVVDPDAPVTEGGERRTADRDSDTGDLPSLATGTRPDPASTAGTEPGGVDPTPELAVDTTSGSTATDPTGTDRTPGPGNPGADPTVATQPGGDLVARADTTGADREPGPSQAASRRWRSLFGMGRSSGSSRSSSGRSPLGGAIGTPQIVVAPGPVPRGDAPESLPYGLEASLMPDWRILVPPSNPLEPEVLNTAVVRSASYSDLSGVWRGTEVPRGAIDGDARVITPAVGFVAVRTVEDVMIDGLLTAVGQGHVWVRTRSASVGIEHERIEEIATIASAGTNEIVVESLDRVRVATPSGVIFGHVLTLDEGRATILTDGGSRITVPSEMVQAVGREAGVFLKHG